MLLSSGQTGMLTRVTLVPSLSTPAAFTHPRHSRPSVPPRSPRPRTPCLPPLPLPPPHTHAGAASSRAFVSRADAERVAQAIGARAYKECSALKIEGVDDVFEAATRASMLMREGVPAHVPSARRERRRSGGVGWRQGQGLGLGQGQGAWEGGRCCVIC